MVTIDIDFDVFKAITARRDAEEVSENDVLRELFGLAAERPASVIPANGVSTAERPAAPGPGWVQKGVCFPNGTEFRAVYKGVEHTGRVTNGALVIKGRSYSSPSNAAVAITGTPVNGWMFWECRRPGETRWQMIKSLRRN